MVFPLPVGLPLSVYENVAYAPLRAGLHDKAELDELVEKCLKQAVLWDEVRDRLDMLGTKLSGGQQQRLTLARALSHRPEILCLDEFSIAIDPVTTMKIEDVLLELKNEMTIVLQHQFWGLDVGEEAFGVTLSFSDVPERLTIPFSAVSAFADPSVRFGLQFDSTQLEGGDAVTPMAAPEQRQQPAAETTADNPFMPVGPAIQPAETAPDKDGDEGAPEDEEAPAGGEDGKVIMLDPYRKK